MSLEMNRINIEFRGLIFIAILVAVWWSVTDLLRIFPSFILPSPRDVWHSFLLLSFSQEHSGAFGGYRASLGAQAGVSAARLLTGFGIAMVIAVPLGMVMAMFEPFDDFIDPLVEILRPIPPIAWTPLAILWFGVGEPSILFIIILGAFWPVLLNTVLGVREVRSVLVRAGQSLGATGFQIFGRVILPASMPYIFTGICIGLTVGWWMIVPAEMIAANAGLGFLIMRARENGQTSDVVTGIIVVGLAGC